LSRIQPWLVHPATSATTGGERISTAFDIMASLCQNNMLAIAESSFKLVDYLEDAFRNKTNDRKNSAERLTTKKNLYYLKLEGRLIYSNTFSHQSFCAAETSRHAKHSGEEKTFAHGRTSLIRNAF
jgi:hypothetical protein